MSGPPEPVDQVIECKINEPFAHWMSQATGSLAVTTYQAGKVALIGWDGRQVSLLLRKFPKPMGLAVNGREMALATRHDLMFLSNDPRLAHNYIEQVPGKYDSIYLPRTTYHTGELNIHDVAFAADGLWMVNTRYSCLSILSRDYSFLPRWKPPFISTLAPEDRCHLNGLTLVDGRPKYVSALGTTNEAGAWRANKANGGILMDIDTNQIIARNLCMPHSPRWHNGKLWVLNSGAGEICTVNPANGKLDVIAVVPGYLRGLTFVDNYAIVALSRIREKHLFSGMPVQDRFKQLHCGVAVVDLSTGRSDPLFEFTAGAIELYDVQFLPNIRRPTMLNLEREASRQAISTPDFVDWLRPEAK